jgi:anhydro-N-acetylmuramic acid kinase
MKNKKMIVAGVMSGTSADGIDVALVEMAEKKDSAKGQLSFRLIGHADYPYPRKVRIAVLAAMNASSTSVADLARLNFLLGELYSDAILAMQRKFRVKADLVGCHGQTLYHQGEAQRFLGRKITATWQTGEGAIIAARVRVPVVTDFRPADMAVGGKGAPLVPFLDSMLFRDAKAGRIALNIGGIANLTAIPAGASIKRILAFDTGPGNMVIDAVTERLFGRNFDRDGRIAASGRVLDTIVAWVLRQEFFFRKPPKTAGREEFGREFVARFLQMCHGFPRHDVVATATAITAKSIADAIRRYVVQKKGRALLPAFRDVVISGGGAKNHTLIRMLGSELEKLCLRPAFCDDFGLPSAAKEAVAFAVLAHETWHRRASNIPSATGAKRAAVLGKISYP